MVVIPKRKVKCSPTWIVLDWAPGENYPHLAEGTLLALDKTDMDITFACMHEEVPVAVKALSVGIPTLLAPKALSVKEYAIRSMTAFKLPAEVLHSDWWGVKAENDAACVKQFSYCFRITYFKRMEKVLRRSTQLRQMPFFDSSRR